MKLIIISLLSVLLFASINAQSDTIKNNDEVISAIKELEKKIDEKNYTRIPNEDFENIIETKISRQVDDKFTFWFTTIGVIFTFLGGAAVFAARKYVSDEINKRIKAESELLVVSLRKEMSEDLDRLRKFQDESKKIIYDVELQAIRKKLQYNDYTVINDLNRLLVKCDEINDESLFIQVIDEIIRIYYLDKNHNEIEKLIEKFSSKYKFYGTTWVNAALLYLNEFESYGAKQQRARGLEYLDKSLLSTPGYGEALALKLLIYMIDYERTNSEEKKNDIIEVVLNMISEINISYELSADETVNRLTRDRQNSIYKKYVDNLYSLFPAELEKMHEIADLYQSKKQGNEG